MAEPILGEGLALQSNWQPDTSKVITAGTGKLLDIDLKKQIAKQKAEEEKAKRLQQIAASIKIDVPKVNNHFLPEAQKLYTNATAEILSASMSGDTAKKIAAEGKYKMLFNNLANQSEAADNFLNAEKSGFIVPQQIKVAFSMPKEQGQAYLREEIKKNPELANLVNINEYGDYAFNTVKNLNLPKDFQSQINAMDNLFEATNQKRINMTTRDEERLYKIPAATLRQEAKLISQDPEVVQNIMLKDRAALDANIKAFKAKNPLIAEDEALALATEKYVFDNLEARNNKYIISNIPQEGKGLGINFGSGFKTPSGWLVTPASGTRQRYEKPELVEKLKKDNRIRKAAGRKELTYTEAYGTGNVDYEEMYIENKDVSENKTFKIPDGKGGFVDMLPVAIRRRKGTNKWELTGKIPKTDNSEEKPITIPYTPDVEAKIDAIIGESSSNYLNKFFGAGVPKTGKPAPAQKVGNKKEEVKFN